MREVIEHSMDEPCYSVLKEENKKLRKQINTYYDILSLLKSIVYDATGSCEAEKRVWPIRAKHYREAKRLIEETERGGEWRQQVSLFQQCLTAAEALDSRYDGMAAITIQYHPYNAEWMVEASWSSGRFYNSYSVLLEDAMRELLELLRKDLESH